MSNALFRAAALQARYQQDQFGEGSNVPPPAHWLVASGALLIILAVAALLLFGSYTASDRVRGFLKPEAGTVQIFAPRSGVIAKLMVRNGDRVTQGTSLLSVSAERQTHGVSVDTQIIAALEAELRGVAGQLERMPARQQQQRAALAAELAASNEQLRFLRTQLRLHDDHLELDAAQQSRLAQLAERGHVAASELQRQRSTRSLLQQQRAEVSREIARIEGVARRGFVDSQELPLRQQDERAELHAKQLRLTRELAAARGAAAFSIDAPTAGVVSGLTRRHGDGVRSNTPLLTIIPELSQYCAILLVPSRAIGFTAVGDTVRVRIDAYPYQKFGVITGTVQAISQTVLLPGEQSSPVLSAEPAYRVRVALNAQSLVAGNDVLPLSADMTVVAEVRRDQRRIIEWLMAPLVSLVASG
ncbi:MAG: HlyD family efflux transporter periplasmic adaptor subunit [Woeseia sp.]|nr:HlyD family secretion protein [Woeseia sp.]MBT8097600.1 HlyD family secretion protein [Woeseia sp.]NNE61433.1 HlyD family efflux transporter periplasmic adaptor subunit [Woeseia sp.]NNL53915.1 HlyD family efflux transporter periplasmic adaptor subunit [Woeseia sp.]